MRLPRISIIYFLIVICGMTIAVKLVFLQIINGDLYRALAKGQQEIFQPILGQRGEIYLYDKDNLTLAAANRGWQLCYASPRIISQPEIAAEKVALILGLDQNRLAEQLTEKDTLFLSLKKRLTQEETEGIMELNIEGIYLQEEIIRYYPFDSMGGDILGFVNESGQGQYGVEGFWNDLLIGREGWQSLKYGPFGKFFRGERGGLEGKSIVLTIDKNIQNQAESLLQNFSERFGFVSGQIVVMEPHSGRVLALADLPGFNPNHYQQYALNNIEIFHNDTIRKLFEPGSIFKTMTMAAGLNEGTITPETTYIDKGYVELSGERISNYAHRVWGESTMTQVLESSINTGAVFAQQTMDDKIFLDYLERFGIFEKTNIGLQGEVYSENREVKMGRKINLATASYGHGIETTLLQMARAYSTVANGGKLIQPYIIEGILENRQVYKLKEESDFKRIITQESAEKLTKMLISVVEGNYARPARVSGYYVAGKTGTSQMPFSSLGINKSGYSDHTWQTFVGFAPAFNPKFVVAIKLDNPNTRTASESATYIFSELTKYILDYYQIPPDMDNF
jgi:cell division protein FtsI/penicillin-binding protein 2